MAYCTRNSGSIGLPEAVRQAKRASLVIHRESTVPTVEVVLQLKLSAFTCRTDEASLVSSQQCDSDALIHPRDRRNKPSCPSVHLPAEAKASRHHHGCLCGTSLLHVRKRNWPKPGNLHRLFGSGYEIPGVRLCIVVFSILYYCIYFLYCKYVFCIIGTDDNTSIYYIYLRYIVSSCLYRVYIVYMYSIAL